MNILFLTSRFPYPPYRGDKLKIYNLIRQLAPRHRISLVSFIASEGEEQWIPALREYCVDVETVLLPTRRSLANCAAGTMSQLPFQVSYFASRGMQRAVERRIGDGQFDIVHVHLIRMAQYAAGLAGKKRILDLTDAGSLYIRRFLETTRNPIHKQFLRTELRRLTAYESILEQFDRCLVCSDVDRDVLGRHAPRANIDLLYNGIDLSHFTADQSHDADPRRIICTGNMSYFPNIDGILYFVREIFPRILKEIADVRLYIVGQDPPRRIRRLAGDRVVVTGFVQDIKEYYLQSSIAIAPIRFGAGTLNKILEPMALGLPVVTTPIGVEGLPLADGRDILIARGEDEFAASVVRLLRDADLRRRIGERGRGIVRSLYDWKSVARSLENIYENVVSGRMKA